MLAEAVRTLVERRELTAALMQAALEEILSGRAHEADMAAFLTALRLRGETAHDIAVTVQTLRRHAVPFLTGGLEVTDTCGTGGDGRSTFNISTATAFVAAGCGVPVVKHGNRGVSSRSGSADVLEALGVKTDVPPEISRRCLEEAGIAFCFAPRYHPAARHAATVRKRLGFRTLFNMVGPLVNPAAAAFQLLGVGDASWRLLLAQAAATLGMKRAYVVHGAPGLDEVSLSGPTQVSVVQADRVTEEEWQPEDFGLPRQTLEGQMVSDADGSARILLRILEGEGFPAAELVLANAAAVLRLCDRVGTLKEGVEQARDGIQSGKSRQALEKLREITCR
jgi:anthranilate phosphoribosyltransferase